MIRKELLRSWMRKSKLTQRELAKSLGISTRTLYTRLKRSNFRSSEIERMIDLMHITNPCEVFFDVKLPKER